jgi:hypothetical protein
VVVLFQLLCSLCFVLAWPSSPAGRQGRRPGAAPAGRLGTHKRTTPARADDDAIKSNQIAGDKRRLEWLEIIEYNALLLWPRRRCLVAAAALASACAMRTVAMQFAQTDSLVVVGGGGGESL